VTDPAIPDLSLGKAVTSDDRDGLASHSPYAVVRAHERPPRPCPLAAGFSRTRSRVGGVRHAPTHVSFGLLKERSNSQVDVAQLATTEK
jgi:hypothetical protein